MCFQSYHTKSRVYRQSELPVKKRRTRAGGSGGRRNDMKIVEQKEKRIQIKSGRRRGVQISTRAGSVFCPAVCRSISAAS